VAQGADLPFQARSTRGKVARVTPRALSASPLLAFALAGCLLADQKPENLPTLTGSAGRAQTADGALGEATNILGRLRELAVESANGSLQDTDRANLQVEFGQLTSEITRIQQTTKFNGQKLLAVTAATFAFQVGINNGTFDKLTVTFGGVSLTTLLAATVGKATSASKTIDLVDAGLGKIATIRAKFGATMNRLEITQSNIQTVGVVESDSLLGGSMVLALFT